MKEEEFTLKVIIIISGYVIIKVMMMNQNPGSLSKDEKRLIWLTTIFVMLVSGSAVWWYWINLPPTVTISMPVVPQPNAFDTYQAASSQFVTSLSYTRPSGTYTATMRQIADYLKIGRLDTKLAQDLWGSSSKAPTLHEIKTLIAKNIC